MEPEYVELISILTSDFAKSISDNEVEKEKLIQAFREYMVSTIESIKHSDSKYINKDIKSVKRVLGRIANEIYGMSVTAMKQRLLEDESFEEIRIISVDAFDLAKRKKFGEKIEVDFDASSKIKQMQELLENVASYNKVQAKKFISEAILDLQYICENEENVSSIRLYHFMKEYDEEER